MRRGRCSLNGNGAHLGSEILKRIEEDCERRKRLREQQFKRSPKSCPMVILSSHRDDSHSHQLEVRRVLTMHSIKWNDDDVEAMMEQAHRI